MKENIEIYNFKAVCLFKGYDVERLKAELDSVEQSSEWFERIKDIWHAIPLRSYHGGITSQDVAHMGANLYAPAKDFQDTVWMNSHCPYLKEIIHALGTEVFKIRLMKMQANSVLHSHVDNFPHTNIVRLHLAIKSDPRVTMTVEDRSWHIGEGELWFTNVKRMHSVQNKSDIDRVHVVFDVAWNDRLEQLFQQAKLDTKTIIN